MLLEPYKSSVRSFHINPCRLWRMLHNLLSNTAFTHILTSVVNTSRNSTPAAVLVREIHSFHRFITWKKKKNNYSGVKINSLKTLPHLSSLDLNHKLAVVWSAWEKQAWYDVEMACSSQACGPDERAATFDVMTRTDGYFTQSPLLISCVCCVSVHVALYF